MDSPHLTTAAALPSPSPSESSSDTVTVPSATVGAGAAADLEGFRIPIPGLEAFYIPEFVTAEEEEYLLRKVDSAPKAKWRTLNGRRLQVWGGELSPSNALIVQPLPPWLTEYPDVVPRIGRTGIFDGTWLKMPNHVIVNEYLPGQGIFAHKDGPAYYPTVATLTLQGHAVMHYHAPLSSTPAHSLLLEPRSLVITTGELYTEYSHSIDAAEKDDFAAVELQNLALLSAEWRETAERGETVERQKRVSLTCRVVERTRKALATYARPKTNAPE
ncbi:hypothetical protein CALVIDRAFT_497232 [Calocera viscosa TUFC12733]|uniref:Alpha-ketoglutarate-dependent dioxygenase AlkB-like domain-containing protein n=1 Tax=Calocera viscosa (strain TUFC12733) TaxID=1330018 RepID=A0A167N9F4_CALVF|nr:hypothetical protein CALVIDRAFT_497232 [Calocera viscosa TUFC12733]